MPFLKIIHTTRVLLFSSRNNLLARVLKTILDDRGKRKAAEKKQSFDRVEKIHEFNREGSVPSIRLAFKTVSGRGMFRGIMPL